MRVSGASAESSNKVGKRSDLFIKFLPCRPIHAAFLIVGVHQSFPMGLVQPSASYFLIEKRNGQSILCVIIVNEDLLEWGIDISLMCRNCGQTAPISCVEVNTIGTLYEKKVAVRHTQEIIVASKLILGWNKESPK